jgi:HEPN domain-containing protein
MQNEDLAFDYISRAGKRLEAVRVLFELESWADVVRESQEIVEICLKALLRIHRIEVPRIHDVSSILEDYRDRFSGEIAERLDEICEISRSLRRDRELAFYGSEDLTPSEFYRRPDAETALAQARLVHRVVAGGKSG